MDADEWAELERLFDLALQLPREARPAWLDKVCVGKEELRGRLERMLRTVDDESEDPRDEDPIFVPGQIVAGRFRNVNLIARGGMGEVYKTRDQRLHDSLIALKTIRPNGAAGRAAFERFLREVYVPRDIADDGICRMYELVEHLQIKPDGSEQTIPCLTMQFLEGESLATLLKRKRPLPLEQALRIIGRVGRSLQVLHDHGIIHRDLKPSNIMLVPKPDGGDHPVIIDFGLAKRCDPGDAAWETQTAGIHGAPYFMSPEAFEGQGDSIAADVYSFGLVIDSLVTERNAYPSESFAELVYVKTREEPEAPSERSTGLPAVWEDVILACLQRDPAKRPQRPLELVKLLECDRTAIALPPRTTTVRKSGISVLGQRSTAPMRDLDQFTRARFSSLRSQPLSRRAWIGAVTAIGLAVPATLALYPRESLEGSLLVFPFRNLTTRPEFDQFCAGTEEELVRLLRYFPKLQIFQVPVGWKLQRSDLEKGRFSLEGSLAFVDGSAEFSMRIRENASSKVTAEWKLPSPVNNAVEVQAEINARTVSELRKTFSSVDFLHKIWQTGHVLKKDSLDGPRPTTENDAALREYRDGQDVARTRSPASALRAIACFERAIAHDPKFALAYAALADIQQVLLLFNRGSTEQLLAEALDYAERAVALDSTLPECHVSLASARQNLWKWPESDQSYRAAIAANPKYPKAHNWYGGFLLQFGQMLPALSRVKQGLLLAPFDDLQQASYGFYLWLAGRSREAVSHLEGLLAHTNIINVHINLGQAYATLARELSEPEATVYYSQCLTTAAEVRRRELADAGGVDPGYLKWSDVIFNQAHVSRGDLNAARHYAHRLEKGMEAGKISASAVAWAYSMINERRRALELLDEGRTVREREMLYLLVHPLYRNLRGEAGFRRLVRDMQLVEPHISSIA